MAQRPHPVAVKLASTPPHSAAADVLALLVTAEEVRQGGPLAGLDRALGGALLAAARAERFEGKPGQELSLTTLGKVPARRVVLLGLGPQPRAEAEARQRGHEAIRAAVGKLSRAAVKSGARSLALAVPAFLAGDAAGAARALVEGALLGAYAFERYKRREEPRPPGLQGLLLLVPRGAERSAAVRDAVALARELAGAVAWARDLVNLGPADCTPALLAAEASALAREAGLAVSVRGPREIAALRMGMFLGVSRGSVEEPRLVQVSWQPRGPGARRPPLVLVGKAITFD